MTKQEPQTVGEVNVVALFQERDRLRVELQAARDEAADARKDAAEADHVCRVTGEKLAMVREMRDAAEMALAAARRTLDEIRALLADWADESTSPDADRVTLVMMPMRIETILAHADRPVAVPETRNKETR